MAAHRRHDISDKVWANIEKLLPGSKGSVGRPSTEWAEGTISTSKAAKRSGMARSTFRIRVKSFKKYCP